MREEVKALEHHANFFTHVVDARIVFQNYAINGNGTTGRFFQEVHATKQGTLTTTGRSDDYQHFLFCNGKVYATQNMQVAEAFM